MIRRTLASLMGNQEPEITEDATLSTPTDGAEQELAAAAPEPAPDDVVETEVEPSAEPEAQAVEASEVEISLPVGMAMISATELQTLRTSAAEWIAKKGEYEVLNTWYNNMKASGSIPQRDVSDAVVGEQKKVSKATQKAIDAKRKIRQAK